MTKKERMEFEQYIKLRSHIRDSHYLQWELLNEKILELIQKTEDLTPEISEDVKKAYDYLSQAIIPSIFPSDFRTPKDYNELQSLELPLLESIPEAIRKTFNMLFKAYLKNSNKNGLDPDDSLYKLLTKFYNENADLRYPNSNTNPYLKYKRTDDFKYNWRQKTTDEFYCYYEGVLTLLSSMRNFQIHKEDAFTSARFELAKRKVTDPISGIENPGNYLVLCSSVILFVYAFIEILQIWIDTQIRVAKI